MKCRIHTGDLWNPHLPECDERAFTKAIAANRGCDQDATEWIGPRPEPIKNAGLVKRKIGNEYFTELSHWGKCRILPEQMDQNLKYTNLEIYTVRVVVGTELQHRFRMVYDVGNGTYEKMLAREQWDELADAGHWNQEAKGDRPSTYWLVRLWDCTCWQRSRR